MHHQYKSGNSEKLGSCQLNKFNSIVQSSSKI